MPALNMITPAQLMRQIGLPDSPIIVDVRIPDDIAPDSRTKPTAIFHAHTDIDGLMDRIADRKAVV
ncbi:MAG: sulfurtransferase, partial [Yoonia sp.]